MVQKNCFAILGIPTDSSQDTARQAYIALVKKVHPDSGQPEANEAKFIEIDNAFKILQAKYAKNRRGIDDAETIAVEEFDIEVCILMIGI